MTVDVTVVLPLYNGLAHLETAVASVRAQTAPPRELIIVDDGGTDGSSELAERIAAEPGPFPIRVLHRENGGQSAARNTAIAEAEGELLAFLDQDDLWYPDHLATLAPRFDGQPDIGLVFCDFDEIDRAGRYVVRGYQATHKVKHPRTSVIDWIASDTLIIPTASLLRTAAVREVGGFHPELIGYEDDDLWIRIFRAGWRTLPVKRPTVAFRVHSGSSSTRASFRRSRVVFFDRVAAMLPDDPGIRRYYTSDVLLPRLVRAALGDYLAAVRHRDWDEAKMIAGTIDELFAPVRTRSRLLRRRERWLLRRPRLARRVLRLRRALGSPLRARLDPTARLRDRYTEWVD